MNILKYIFITGCYCNKGCYRNVMAKLGQVQIQSNEFNKKIFGNHFRCKCHLYSRSALSVGYLLVF